MTARRTAPNWLKPAMEYGPIAVFFVAYLGWGLLPATAALLAATIIGLVVSLLMVGRVPLMPLVTAIIVAVFGGLTFWLHDDTFIKMKPTIVQLLFAAVLLGGLAVGKPLLKPLLGTAWSLDDSGWRKLTFRFGLFFIAMAILNEIVWRTQSDDVWVSFKVFGILVLTMLFAVAQAPLMTRHKLPDASPTGGGYSPPTKE